MYDRVSLSLKKPWRTALSPKRLEQRLNELESRPRQASRKRTKKAAANLDAYLKAAGMADQKGTPLWRAMTKERGWGDGRMSRQDVFRIIKRRCKDAKLGTTPQRPSATAPRL
jgi:hypothetical protein